MAQVKNILSLPVIVGSLGYFIDLFDLILFSAVRVPSLEALGLQGDALLEAGFMILNAQMTGLILGGILFGVLADKFGRTRMMFLSIATYSLATLACAFVPNIIAYAGLRFISGVGIAAEFGLAVTLLSEILPKSKRGYAIAILAGFGITGAVFAAFLAQILDWQSCYIIGGLGGLALLILRTRILESHLFEAQASDIQKGSLLMLLSSPSRVMRYLVVILAGGPIIYILWLMATFAPEFTVLLGLSEPMTGAEAVMFAYIGLALGDLASGCLSAYFRTRKLIAFSFWAGCLVLCLSYFFLIDAPTHSTFIAFYLGLGFFAGYWVLTAVMAVELFGTNLRATVGSSISNFIRASFIPMGFGVSLLKPELGLINASLVVGAIVFALSFVALLWIPETHDKDLDYQEQ